MIVVVPDINVLVSKLYADKAAKSSTISQKVVLHLVSGSINGDPVQIAMSFKMLDTYREVLLRKEYPEALVEEEISALVDMMKFGPAGFDPHIVLGGSPDPALKDLEDGGVLATAYAAHAGILITDNLKDFAGQDAETYRTSRVQAPDGKPIGERPRSDQRRHTGLDSRYGDGIGFAHAITRRRLQPCDRSSRGHLLQLLIAGFFGATASGRPLTDHPPPPHIATAAKPPKRTHQ